MPAKRLLKSRSAYTLIELLVVIAIMLALAALAAAFLPRINGNQSLIRSMDQLEQWLLTAKMRAKRDGLPTGLRFNPDPNNPGMFSEAQYIQQPDALSGGTLSTQLTAGSIAYSAGPPPLYLSGGIMISALSNTVTFGNVDFTNGQPGVIADYLVQTGDFLEVRGGGGVHMIGGVSSATTLMLGGTTTYDSSLVVAAPTTNYRILRQPRLMTGESPLELPNNFFIDGTNPAVSNIPFRPVVGTPNGGYFEILFSPSGSVVGHGASNGKIYFYVHELNQTDPNQAGIIAVQTRTGFIGAYNVAPGTDPLSYAEEGRNSGL